MNKIALLILASAYLSAESIGTLSRSESGFVMKPLVPFVPETCEIIPVKETVTGFLFTGRILWGEGQSVREGTPYAKKLVFVSEGKSREWEYVGTTDNNGTFSVPIKPYTRFNVFAWDGSSAFFAKYDGHFYYNSELHNLYQTPTGGDPFIADKGDVVIVDLDAKGN